MAAKYTPREFVIEDAVRRAANVKVGLFSPSGGGKTFTALRLATGIQEIVGGDIVFVDTENGRGRHYADMFKFKHIDFRPPFSSLAYVDAMRAADRAGAIIVVDSMSHEHEGEGGMLAYQEAEVDRMAGDDWRKREAVKMLAWAKPKADRRRLLNEGVLGVNAHLILCFRAKNTAKPVKVTQENGSTKTEVIAQGFMPIAGDEFVWEMDLAALFMPGAAGVPTWSSPNPGESMMIKVPEQFASVRKTYKDKPIDEELGRNLARWAIGGVRGKKEEPAPAASGDGADSSSGSSREREGNLPPPAEATQGPAETGDLLDPVTETQAGADQDQAASALEAASEPPVEEETGFGLFAVQTAEASDWPTARGAMSDLAKSTAWKEAGKEMQARARVITYRRLLELNELGAKVDMVDDPHAFRCYIEFETDGEALLGNERVFKEQAGFKGLSPGSQQMFAAAVQARLEAIRLAATGAEEFS